MQSRTTWSQARSVGQRRYGAHERRQTPGGATRRPIGRQRLASRRRLHVTASSCSRDGQDHRGRSARGVASARRPRVSVATSSGRPSWDEYRQDSGLPGGGVFRPYEADIEPWAEFVARVSRTLYDILFEYAGRFLVVVTHEEIIDATLRTFGDLPLRGPFDVRVTPTSITEWTTTDDLLHGGPPDWGLPRWRLERFNDAGHLEPRRLDD